MSEVRYETVSPAQAAANRLPDSGLVGGALMGAVDLATRCAGALSAATLLFMTASVVYEVTMRSAFNRPTIWVAEISVYAFVALVFLGLAVAQRRESHIRVEILVDNVPPAARQVLELVGAWLALAFAGVTGWQMLGFVIRDYVNGTRDWGLLSTLQWIPETPVVVGYALFCAALLREICRKTAPEAPWRRAALPLILAGVAAALWVVGRRDLPVAGTPLDWATLAILGGAVLGALAWSGARVGLGVLLILVAFGGVAAFAAGVSPTAAGLALVAGLMTLLVLGVPVGAALGLAGMIGLLFMLRQPQLAILADRSWTAINSFTLTAVPTFVLMGSLLVQSGVTGKFFDALVVWFGRPRGGLAHAAVAASAVFAAVSGSSLATAATLGRVAAPEMIARGYSNRLTYGLVAAGATLGILIPPSIAMIIYGNSVGAPITVLFVAGIVPGLMLAALFMLAVVVWSYLSPRSVPPGMPYPMARKFRSLTAVLPFLLLIAAVLGSLYFGIATPTEAGAVGAAAAFALCVQQRRMNLRVLYDVLLETVAVTAFIMLIVVGASIFGWVFDFLRLPRELVGVVTSWNLPPWTVLAMIAAFYLVLGMFVESISMMLMTLSVTFPIVVALGFDPIWFGVVLVILVEIGLVTPPVGIVLFILRGMSAAPLRDIMIGVLPFVALMLGFVALLTRFPEIVLWLPRQMG